MGSQERMGGLCRIILMNIQQMANAEAQQLLIIAMNCCQPYKSHLSPFPPFILPEGLMPPTSIIDATFTLCHAPIHTLPNQP